MIGGKIESIIVFFPLMELKQIHQLKFGEIGPVTKLQSKYPLLAKIYPALTQTVVDEEYIKEPVVAVATTNNSKLIRELECIGFIAESRPANVAEEEILSQRTIFTTHNKDNEDTINVNHDSLICSVETLQNVHIPSFPKAFRRWDLEALARFEVFLSSALQEDLYNALVSCLSDSQDKEVRRERARIIISVTLYNDAFLRLQHAEPFSKHAVVLIAGAFEALLNLPSESLRSSFANVLMTLIGIRTTPLKRWCEEFYNLRSGLVHGDTAWEKDEVSFDLPGRGEFDHSLVARHLFIHCLKTKLFLSGLLKNYDRSEFESELIDSALADANGT